MSDVDNKVKMIVEGLLLSAGRPLSLDNIIAVFSEEEKPDRQELKAVMEAIAEDCDDRGFELKEVASGFRFQVKQELSEWVAKLWEERPPRYTRALLETLALIAYRQPITRGDIEEIRGVAVSANIIRTLLDREWIRIVGHRDVPGRPAMFATTRQFLDYFNLKSLQELPPLAEIKGFEDTAQELDLEDGLANQRVIDLPEEAVDENSLELSDEEKAEMLAEDEAIALAKKPLDEILSLDPARARDEEESDEDDDGERDAGDEPEPAGESSESSEDQLEDGQLKDGQNQAESDSGVDDQDEDEDLAAVDEILAEVEGIGKGGDDAMPGAVSGIGPEDAVDSESDADALSQDLSQDAAGEERALTGEDEQVDADGAESDDDVDSDPATRSGSE